MHPASSLVTWVPLVLAYLEDDVLGLLLLKHRAEAVLEHEMKRVGNQGLGKQFLQESVTVAEKGVKLPTELIMLDFFRKARCVTTKDLKWLQHKCGGFKKKLRKEKDFNLNFLNHFTYRNFKCPPKNIFLLRTYIP